MLSVWKFLFGGRFWFWSRFRLHRLVTVNGRANQGRCCANKHNDAEDRCAVQDEICTDKQHNRRQNGCGHNSCQSEPEIKRLRP